MMKAPLLVLALATFVAAACAQSYPPPAYPPPAYGSYPPPAYPPPPPSIPETTPDLANSPTSEGSVTAVPTVVELTMTNAGCTSAQSNTDYFVYLYRVTTGEAWNASDAGQVEGQTVFAADVEVVVAPTFSCSSASGRLRALMQGSGTASFSNTKTNLPSTVTAAEADANSDSYKAALVTGYTSGTFANTFGVTAANVTVESAVSTSTDDSSNNNLALGLGLGLGLGIPFLACCIIAVVLIMRRRKAQAVGQSSGDDGAEADEEQ